LTPETLEIMLDYHSGQQWKFGMKRTSFAKLCALLAAVTATEASAQTAPKDLCGFLQKVLEAKAQEFAPFKGEAQNRAVFGDTVFHGTFLPPSGTECTLHTRTKVGSAELPPIYDCTLASISDFGQAERVFTRAAIELRACFPLAQFVVMYDGEAKTPRDQFSWVLHADAPGFSLELQMSNMLALLGEAFGGGPVENPAIAVTIDVTDTTSPGDAI
jgi:hypothetical protein